MVGPFKMKGWSPFTKLTDPKKKVKIEEESEETVRKDVSTKTILEQQWAKYQASLPKDHPDKGKPVPKQAD